MDNSLNVPDFDGLPDVEGMPKGCAWGVFDKDGQKDVYGTLNFLTPEVVREAAKEVQEGVSVSLNWPIDAIRTPVASRKPLEHNVLTFQKAVHGYDGFDDEVKFNTQCSSQWDSLCHYPHQPSGTGYNGGRATVKELQQPADGANKNNPYPTLEHWHKRGGLVGRGVLIDYKLYAEKHGIEYSPFSSHVITTAEIEAIAREQNVTFKFGDVLIVRSGFTEAMAALSDEDQLKMLYSYRFCGIEGTQESAKWFWNKHFSAAAGDSISFEVSPPQVNGKDGTLGDYVLHPYLLSFYGMPIGELWDLKALSEQCQRSNRWSFMITSMPLNLHGEIGSPPNAVAIF